MAAIVEPARTGALLRAIEVYPGEPLTPRAQADALYLSAADQGVIHKAQRCSTVTYRFP